MRLNNTQNNDGYDDYNDYDDDDGRYEEEEEIEIKYHNIPRKGDDRRPFWRKPAKYILF